MKTNFLRVFYSLILVCVLTNLKSQQDYQLINSGEVLLRGIELHDKQSYDEAIAEFNKIERNDTNYSLALVELVNSYIASGKDSLAVIACDKGIDLNSQYQNSFFLYKANALDNMKKYEESKKVYAIGMKRFPKSNMYFFEMGTACARQDKLEDAKKYFQKSIELNPYHPGSHYQLGLLSLRQGKIVPAMMALQFFLILENKTNRAQQIVPTLESVVKGEFDFSDIIPDKSLAEGEDDFSELETIIKSKMALNEKYKPKSDLTYPLVKQIQVMLEKVEYNKGDKGFFMQTYAPFYSELYKKDFFEPFVYNILSGMEIEKIDKWVTRHESDYKRFANWAVEYIGKNLAFYEEDMNGQKIKVTHWYDNHKLSAEGNEDATKKLQGYWKFYYPSAQLKSEGTFDNTGEKNGLWKFYHHNGNLKEIVNYKSGIYDGEKLEYYESGAPMSKLLYKNNKLDGINITYYPSGEIKGSYSYKEDKANGPEITYFRNGKKNTEATQLNGIISGDVLQYYESGNLLESTPIVNGKREGFTIEYHDLPGKIKKSEGAYKEGNPVGDWKFYHDNGKTREEGKYNEKGQKIGPWKSYNEDGLPLDEITYTESGKLTGPHKVFNKGKDFAVYEYKNGELVSYKFALPDGKTIGEGKRSGKTLNYIFYYANGSRRKEGKLVNDKDEGEVRYYNQNNVLTGTEYYKDGMMSGIMSYYHENGKISSEVVYTDNQLNGYYKNYYSNGKMAYGGWYKNGMAQGTWTYYNENGTKASEKYYLNDNLAGWQTYYNANGSRDIEEYYEDDLITKIVYCDSLGNAKDTVKLKWGTGDLVTHFAGGTQVRMNGKRKAGYSQGKLTRYFPNGKTETDENFLDGELDGEYTSYWLNGKPKVKCMYNRGKVDGLYKSWHENGNIEHEWDFKNGSEEGVHKNYFPSGKLAREAEYKRGKIVGFIKIYAEDGSLVFQRNYDDDRLISYSYLDKTGKMVTPVEIKDETGKIIAYFQNGQKSIDAMYKNGALEGKRVEYHPTGKTSRDEFYSNGREEGVQKTYYPGGQLKSEENFICGKKYGLCKFYFENGKTEREEYYFADEENGTWKFYDNTGKLLKTQVWANAVLQSEKNN